MKIDKLNEQINLFKNCESVKGGVNKSFESGAGEGVRGGSIDERIIEIARKHADGMPVNFEESKKVTEILQEENDLIRYLNSGQREELNTMIAEFLMNDPVLSSKLLHILRGLKS